MVVIPAGGDSVDERGDNPRLLEGSLRVLDMLLLEVERTNGVVSIIRTKADPPTKPDRNRVKFFLDIEGGASIQYDEPEPEFHRDRRLAMLRHFFRLGCRGMQMTHNGRNMLGVGIGEGKVGHPMSEFGVEVVHEMNRLGMVIGVSHLSSAGVAHIAKLSKHPIVSTHQNLQAFLKAENPLHLSDEEVKQIASTGGVVGMRYIKGQAGYELLADEIAYIVKLVGEDHAAIGWLVTTSGRRAPRAICRSYPTRAKAPGSKVKRCFSTGPRSSTSCTSGASTKSKSQNSLAGIF